ncbi:hypothetical protein C8F01DRAFT_351684 [Mycena amicta]|nr:hypothetical protein C8F01DRAFT_351684 [Mycena amicta]
MVVFVVSSPLVVKLTDYRRLMVLRCCGLSGCWLAGNASLLASRKSGSWFCAIWASSALYRQCLRIAGVSTTMSHWLHLPACVRARAFPSRLTSTSFGVMRLAFAPLDNARIPTVFDIVSTASRRPILFARVWARRFVLVTSNVSHRLHSAQLSVACAGFIIVLCVWVLPNSLRGRCGGGRIPFGGGWGFPPGRRHTHRDLWEARTRTRALIYGFYPASCHVWAGQIPESCSILYIPQGFVGFGCWCLLLYVVYVACHLVVR